MKYQLLIVLMLLVPIAFANVEIDRIKVYVEDEAVDTADEDGGNIKVNRNDLIEMVLTIQNNYNESATIKYRGYIEDIDDGNDIEKELDLYDVESNDDRSKTLTFIIPDDAKIDEYNMYLKIEYNTTFTNGNFERSFDVKVLEPDESALEIFQFESSFNNLTSVCSDVVETVNGCFGYIDNNKNLTYEISSCKEAKGTCQSSLDDCTTDLGIRNTEKDEFLDTIEGLNEQISDKENEISSMLTISSCDTKIADAIKDSKKKSNNQLLMWGAAAAVGFYFWNERKKKGTVADAAYNQKTL